MNFSVIFGVGDQGGPDPKPLKNGKANGKAKQTRTVLAIEDSEADVVLLRSAFEDVAAHCGVEWAASPAAAIERFKSGKPLPDLVLLDLQLGTETGLAFLTWLRTQGNGWQRIPVVILSTSQELGEVRRAYDLGANSYLVKPTGYEELKSMVARLASYWLDQNRPA